MARHVSTQCTQMKAFVYVYVMVKLLLPLNDKSVDDNYSHYCNYNYITHFSISVLNAKLSKDSL